MTAWGCVSAGLNTRRTTVGSDSDGLDDETEGNLISGNLGDGVRIYGSLDNKVTGNLIGTDATGRRAIPNYNGVRIQSNSARNQIGGDTQSLRNIISGGTLNPVS